MNLPIILLKGSSFLPYTELKLEIDNEESKDIINTASFFHKNYILLATKKNAKTKDLPKWGTISKITEKKLLPNGNMQIVIVGKERATILEYLSRENEILETIIEKNKKVKISEEKEKEYVKNVKKHIREYIDKVPTVSNAILHKMEKIETLEVLLDVATIQILPSSYIEKYVSENDPKIRMQFLLEDIEKEKLKTNIDTKIAVQLEKNVQNAEKEYMVKEKIRLLKEEIGETDSKNEEIEKLRERVNNAQLPEDIAQKVETEIGRYLSYSPLSPEAGITYNYIENVLSLPWNQYTEDCTNLLEVRKKLDETHYDLVHIKDRIIEFLASKQMNPEFKSPIICLVGPAGVGKTSLAFSIAGAMGRSFVKMSVGGMTDEGEILGHRRTYMGARPGRIVQLLKKAKTMNPVFLIDEIDKMVKGAKGDPMSALLDVLDPVQNKYFTDHYIEEEIDLSSVFFITTANSMDEIPEEIKDRLEIIEVEGYTELEKIEIAKKYLIPSVCNNYKMNTERFIFTEATLTKMIREYTREVGVRSLERKITEIIRHIVTDMVLYKTGRSKYHIEERNLYRYLGKPLYPSESNKERNQIGTVYGMGYTSYGGSIFPIEVTYYKGEGNLILTGTLGDTLKESAMVALSYLKKNAKHFHIDYDKMCKNDIHIHIPNGAVYKDGPSAGTVLTTALLSAFTGQKVSSHTALTGEMTLRGQIMPVGKIKQKVLAAYEGGITKMYLPRCQQKEVKELPASILEKIECIWVQTYQNIYTDLFLNNKIKKGNLPLQKSA